MKHERKVEGISAASKAHIPKEWIETAAYYRWEKRGRPHGDHHADWLEAERKFLEGGEFHDALKNPVPPPPDPPKDPEHSRFA